MDNYRPFDQLRVNELTVLRHGFWRSSYELSDGQFTYGWLSYTGFFRQTGILNVANKSWTITRKGMLSRTLFINDTYTGELIGEIKPETWSRKIGIALNDGFQAFFTNKKVFSRVFTLFTETDGDLAYIDPKVWKFKTPFKVSFDPVLAKKIPNMPLLILSGIYLALLRQQQAAASH